MQPQSLMGTSYQILTGKRDAKEITFFTLQAVLLLSGECESPIHLSLANNYADDALRAFLHFLLAFTLVVFVVNLGGESSKQILGSVFCSSYSRGNIRIFLMEKRKLGSVLRKRGSWKPLVVSTDGKFTMQSLQVSLSLSFPFSTNSFSNHTID